MGAMFQLGNWTNWSRVNFAPDCHASQIQKHFTQVGIYRYKVLSTNVTRKNCRSLDRSCRIRLTNSQLAGVVEWKDPREKIMKFFPFLRGVLVSEMTNLKKETL
jgi:hypothetical protein